MEENRGREIVDVLNAVSELLGKERVGREDVLEDRESGKRIEGVEDRRG